MGSRLRDALRGRIAVALVTLLEYGWRMGSYRRFGRTFPVTLATPNPLRADDTCQNHEICVQSGTGLVDVIDVRSAAFAPVVSFLDGLDFDRFLYGRRGPVRPEDAGSLPYRVGNLLALRRQSEARAHIDVA